MQSLEGSIVKTIAYYLIQADINFPFSITIIPEQIWVVKSHECKYMRFAFVVLAGSFSKYHML